MITISLCMIVKNEENNLVNCLESIGTVMDEIIIVDTGSTDRTKEIAHRYTPFVYDFVWEDDFASARNYAFSKATKEYIMWLDADDILEEEERLKLIVLKESLEEDVDTVLMKYKVSSKQQEMTRVFLRERLMKRSCQFKWYNPVHEYVLYGGKCKSVDITISHTKRYVGTRRNLEIYEKYIATGGMLSERDYYYYAGELLQDKQIDKAIVYYKKFLKSKGQLVAHYLDVCIKLASCYSYEKDDVNELKSLLRYFEIDQPRAEICCQLGYYYKKREMYDKAIAWFSVAPSTPKPREDMGGLMPLCWGYIPYMELCACYYKKGDIANAIIYNEKAGNICPNNEMVVHNRIFLGMELEKRLKNK